MKQGVLLFLAALVLHLVLIQPNHPAALTPGALLLFPLELPAILLLLAAMPSRGRATSILRAVIVSLLVVFVVMKSLDFGMYSALGRAFNPVADWPLVASGWQVAQGALGPLSATGVAILGPFAFILMVWLVWWATGAWAKVALPRLPRNLAAGAAMVAALIATADVSHAMRGLFPGFEPPGAAFTTRVAIERARLYGETLADLARFDRAARTDPYAGKAHLFDRLDGHDVELIFVESYGRASFDNPLYAPTHMATLRDAQEEIAAAGLAMRSGWLTSPIAGGQSWLAHATIASGLKTDGQTRYAALLASPRKTLFHLASEAGYRTAAVMPAITMPWPEADALGFETVLAADDLGYRGQPFNWVTMPDQFTLSRYRDLLGTSERPSFIQTALISSHAPWVPVPELVPWDEVGDGEIFDRWATYGETPAVIWRDRDRVRDQYRMSIDYALRTVMSFAARRGADAPLMVILGDHPAAQFVSQIDSFDVAVHLIGPPRLLAAIDDWALTPGLVPAADAPVWPMEDFRDRFVEAFSTGAGPSMAGRSLP
ncbi:sulfatase-like hydrolase/transferase [Mesorhizobium sp. CAU 1741]|uniref:sulfatase-like hydrolase/transferase n=1 Tax=Mesorhizobium sp. CAU 1741 TaxID=3140366 RepID=UPI00325A5CD5